MKFSGIWHTADEELALMNKYFGENKIVLEVGSFEGYSAIKLSEKNIVVTIDPFVFGYNDIDKASKTNFAEVRKTFLENIEGKKIISIRQKSEDVLKWWHQPIDNLYIDGNHVKEALLIDMKFIDFVKDNGYIAFHDYHPEHPDVIEFVDKFIRNKYKFIDQLKRIIIFQKAQP